MSGYSRYYKISTVSAQAAGETEARTCPRGRRGSGCPTTWPQSQCSASEGGRVMAGPAGARRAAGPLRLAGAGPPAPAAAPARGSLMVQHCQPLRRFPAAAGSRAGHGDFGGSARSVTLPGRPSKLPRHPSLRWRAAAPGARPRACRAGWSESSCHHYHGVTGGAGGSVTASGRPLRPGRWPGYPLPGPAPALPAGRRGSGCPTTWQQSQCSGASASCPLRKLA